jgi:Uma2 family endonuclease
MDTVLTPLLQSPKLPDYVRELNDFLKAEQKRREDFYRTVRDDQKSEFINGEVVCHSPAKEMHNFIRQNLELIFVRYVRKQKKGIIRTEKSLVKLTRNDFEPDICFFNREKAASLNGNTLFYPAPDFVVEILSSSTEKRDRGVKKADYALHGVQEYWIVNPDTREVEQYLLAGEQYELKEKMGHGTVRCAVLSGLEIPLSAIFEEEENEKFLQSF